jgi:hypothetical protein
MLFRSFSRKWSTATLRSLCVKHPISRNPLDDCPDHVPQLSGIQSLGVSEVRWTSRHPPTRNQAWPSTSRASSRAVESTRQTERLLGLSALGSLPPPAFAQAFYPPRVALTVELWELKNPARVDCHTSRHRGQFLSGEFLGLPCGRRRAPWPPRGMGHVDDEGRDGCRNSRLRCCPTRSARTSSAKHVARAAPAIGARAPWPSALPASSPRG